MATERNTRREILKKLLTVGPLAALAGAIGINGAKTARAQTIGDPDVTVTGNLTVNGTGNSSIAGKLGIGTTNPGAYKLSVNGEVNAQSLVTSYVNTGPLNNPAYDRKLSYYNDSGIWFGNEFQANVATWIQLRTSSPGGTVSPVMTLDRNGNAGIGTTTPQCRLDVKGDVQANVPRNYWTFEGPQMMNGGYAGDFMGTVWSPGELQNQQVTISVEAKTTGSSTLGIYFPTSGWLVYNMALTSTFTRYYFTVTFPPNETRLRMYYTGSNGETSIRRGIITLGSVQEAYTYPALSLQESGATRICINGKFFENSFFNTGGNIGIGTTTPVYPLDVVGAIHATGGFLGTATQAYYGA